MVEKVSEVLRAWWQVIAGAVLALLGASIATGITWGMSMAKLDALAQGQTQGHTEIASVLTKLDVVSRELNDAKMAALMAKVQADRTQAQMDDISRDFRALQQKLIFINPMEKRPNP
jgi:hypothetical protein